MPGQDLEKQPNYTIKLLNMEPGIPENRSLQNLVDAEESVNSSGSTTSLRDVKFREWITVIILCFVNLINYMDRFTLAGVLTDIQKDFNIGDSEGGLLQTAFILSYMVFAPIFGYLGDRYSRPMIMAFGVFLWSLTTVVGSYMNNFTMFILFRTMVGIGEASYSTIAPTIISDLFVKDVRSKMLALFYFAIPVGSGMGYIVGSETARLASDWRWGLRVTPFLGAAAVLLIIFVLRDPQRGESEGASSMHRTTWLEDVQDILKNPSFMLSTAGFTCVAFVAGALSWWGPKFIYLGIKLQPGSEDITLNDVSYKFGIVAMISGLLGVPAGSAIAQALRPKYRNIDPMICAVGLILSSPLLYVACITSTTSSVTCYFFVFFGEICVNLTWSIVADILLYVVVPTRRSTAEGFQLLVSHALGDAGSPYIIGMVSDALRIFFTEKSQITFVQSNGTSVAALQRALSDDDQVVEFRSLQYALFITCFVEILGGVFFLINALYIVKDRTKVEHAVKHAAELERSSRVIVINESEQRTLMS